MVGYRVLAVLECWREVLFLKGVSCIKVTLTFSLFRSLRRVLCSSGMLSPFTLREATVMSVILLQ